MAQDANVVVTRATKVLLAVGLVVLIGYVLPERVIIPVKNATQKSWNPQSFWYEPWGKSGVHKGIDIFANRGTDVISTTDGIIFATGQNDLGGNFVIVLGSHWHFHYYAHLDSIDTHSLHLVSRGEKVGTVGDTGNAKGKPTHLHYAIVRMIPFPWKIDTSTQGWKKMFFVDPDEYLSPR